MNARNMAFVACRLFAVYLFVIYVLNFTLQAVGVFAMRNSYPELNDVAYLGLIFAPIFSALIAAVLWFGAGWISSGVSRALPEEGNAKGIDLVQWKALIIAAIGVLFILKGTDSINQVLKLLIVQAPSPEDRFLPFLAGSSMIYILMGIALIAGLGTIAGGFKALQSWLTKPAFTGEDQ
ncbi:MAG: hypothetical protein WBQ60_05170 [Asticcacaulis sp.]